MYKLVPEPSQECIQRVIAATRCTASRAKIYLKTHQNDVEKAISQLQVHRKSYADLKGNSQQPITSSLRPPSLSGTSISGDSITGTESLSETSEATGTPTTPLSIPRTPTPPGYAGKYSPHWKVKESNQILPTPPSLESVGAKQDPNFQKEPLFVPVALHRSNTKHGDTHKEAYFDSEQKVVDSSTWDFRLPILAPTTTFQPGIKTSTGTFSIEDLVAAVQQGVPVDLLRTHVSHFSNTSPQRLRDLINSDVKGFPAMFYAVAMNNDAYIRLFVEAGGDLNVAYGTPRLPLLAFAIINSKIIEHDTTSIVALLLGLGATEDVIPKAFYHPFDQDLPISGPKEEDLVEDLKDPRKQWCKPPSVRKLLVETLNITQRYYLYRSTKLPKPTGRQKDVAARHNSTDMFGIPYFLVGQNAATELLTKNIFHYMLRRQKQPLVLVFAGPSGHGKTELAGRLGGLLSLDLHVSDCATVSREMELFGPLNSGSNLGAEDGSPLNNFLASHDGSKSIVFLDHFEKTTKDTWSSLLLPFDKGEYQDRRNLKTINCRNTIWVLATNALDGRITNFCENNEATFDEENSFQRESLFEELTFHMKNDFVSAFSAPLTGRISTFVPFLPFSPQETRIGAHKYLLELRNEVRRPVCTAPGSDEHLIGNIRLKICDETKLCSIITRDYDPALGMRSLRKSVMDRVASLLDSEYLATHDSISESVSVEDYSIAVSNGRIKVHKGHI
jgi:hypothetical protein